MGEPIEKLKPVPSRGEDVLSDSSRRSGIAGFFETVLRRFRNLAFVILLVPLILVALSVLGLSIAPAAYVFAQAHDFTQGWSDILRYPALGISFAAAYLIYGVTLIFLVPLANFLMPFRVREWRGIWFSLPTIPWFFHNALTYLVRYTFLELATPTPLNILFYRMMGMKIGKGVVINTTNISDPALIEIGDYVTIGGSAHLLAHYGQKGYLVLSKVRIGKGSTIGLKASVMGGAQIGEKCIIKPHVAVLPKTVVPDGQTL